MHCITSTTFLTWICSLQFASAEAIQIPPEKSEHGLIGDIGDRDLQQCNINVTSFELINARTGKVLESLPNVIDYDNDTYATGLNIVARLSKCPKTRTVQSVMLEFDNPAVSFCTNRTIGVPFSVFGIKASNQRIIFRPIYFPLGYRTVGATPYLRPNCRGRPQQRLSSTFEVRGCLDGFNFYDADTDLIFTGNLANPPCNLNIEVKISDDCGFPVKSVLLKLTDLGGNVVASHADTGAPYLLYGDSNSDIQPFQLPTGFYRITASLNGRGPSLFANFTLGACTPDPQPPTMVPTAPKPSPTTDFPSIAPSSAPTTAPVTLAPSPTRPTTDAPSRAPSTRAPTAPKPSPTTDAPSIARLDDGTYCLDGTTCNGCKNGYETWWKATPIGNYCGTEPRYPDKTSCLDGTSCNHCQNGYEWWYMATGGTPGYYCGKEPRYADGTGCFDGTSCYHCQNGYTRWCISPYLCYLFSLYYCGTGPRYPDGTSCLEGTSCNYCLNGYEWWYTANGYYCGQEPRYGDGTPCTPGTTCNRCENAATWWVSKDPNGYYCGRCWSGYRECDENTCGNCCNGGDYYGHCNDNCYGDGEDFLCVTAECIYRCGECCWGSSYRCVNVIFCGWYCNR